MKSRYLKYAIALAVTFLFSMHAYAGYSSAVPRWVTLYPSSSTMGASGYVRVVLLINNIDTQFYFCSTGATDAVNCELNSLYNNDQLLALYQNLQRANVSGQKVVLPLGVTAPRGTVLWFGYP